VLDTEPSSHMRAPTCPPNERMQLADVTVTRTRDLGMADKTRTVTTHLGRFLHSGDIALGYHLETATFDIAEDASRGGLAKRVAQQLPDVLLVRKGFRRNRRSRRRIWTLQRLERDGTVEADTEPSMGTGFGTTTAAAASSGGRRTAAIDEDREEENQRDMEQLMQELEEDPELRANVPLVRVPDAEQILAARAAAKDTMRDEGEAGDSDEEEEDPNFPDVQISELVEPMQNLSLSSRLAAAQAAAAAEVPQAADDDSD